MTGALLNMIGLGDHSGDTLCRKRAGGPNRLIWPRPAGAWGSLEHDLALAEAFGEPAGRRLNNIVFDIGAKGLAAKAHLHLNPKKEAARQRKAAQVANAEDKQASFFPLGPLGLAGNTDREFRHGYYINPNPTCDLTTPPPPPPLTAEGRAEREALDRSATGFILQNLAKYVDIVKNVSLFSEMGATPSRATPFSVLEMGYDQDHHFRYFQCYYTP